MHCLKREKKKDYCFFETINYNYPLSAIDRTNIFHTKRLKLLRRWIEASVIGAKKLYAERKCENNVLELLLYGGGK